MNVVRPASKLDAVQVLRAFAALMVVVGHVLGAVEQHPDRFGAIVPIRYAGGAGVDVFFLISGFIMVFSSGRMFGSSAGARDFMWRRLVRILPPYWVVTGAMLLLLAAKPEGVPSFAAIAATFAFVPYDTMNRGDGFALPVVDLGWTLNYEMMFYVVFALFVPLGRARGVLGISLVMVLMVLAGSLIPASATQMHFWTRGIILEFVAGMLVALTYLAGRLRLSASARAALVIVAVAYYLADPAGMMGRAMTPNDLRRVAGWGVPAMLLLVAALSGPTSFTSRAGRWAMLLGDSSYVLYLLHPFVLIAMLQVFRFKFIPPAITPVTFVILTVLLACVASIAAHLFVERPVVTRLTQLLQRRGAPIGAVPMPPDTRVTPSG